MTKLKSKEGIIDLNKWTSQRKFSQRENIKETTVNQWVSRVKAGSTTQPIEIIEIPELDWVLVRKKV